ncbi:AraC family transcriptional regulator [Aquimarina sp. 2201CG5-10]|uniref:helix-turn-helix domain-containing protein n=1 Tax=Aquimarina callyspongiae TaxID=3098150 RepID=UPI002AB54B29|nr:AraC family transcriptional regulator [Aquimarina sp. 2201CG5-10]MDY8135547.1 AraC family transcriptional regulator [Aquimarina sp. 2201CG5-10]
MEINYNIVSLIDTLGLIQGVILGLLLIIINRKKDKSTLYLGLFIIAFALNLLPTILEDLKITEFYPKYDLLPLEFIWLLFPLFYIYVQQISILPENKLKYWVLVPALLVLIIDTIVFFQSVDTKKIIEESLWYNLKDVLGLIFSYYIGFKTLGFIKKHIQELKDQYTSTEFRELRWARFFVGFGLLFTFVTLVSGFFDTGFYFLLIVSTINVMLLYWISVRGILQQNVQTLVSVSKEENTDNRYNRKAKSSKTEEVSKKLLQQIEQYIISEKVYIQPDLTIIDISEKVDIHPKRISGIINSLCNKNFNSYINSFRIEKAKELLSNNLFDHLSIEGIGKEVGFNSKSTFYDAFKKHTDTTPSSFKNNR